MNDKKCFSNYRMYSDRNQYRKGVSRDIKYLSMPAITSEIRYDEDEPLVYNC